MRIIPFPDRDDAGPDVGLDANWLSELEAALSGTGEGPGADSWRQLRDDVRALAPPIAPEFERKLGERIAERGARSASKQPRRRSGWWRQPGRLRAAAAVAAIGVIAAVVVASPWRAGTRPIEAPSNQPAVSPNAGRGGPSDHLGLGAPRGTIHAARGATAEPSASASAGAASSAPAFSGVAAPPGRVQQLAASITLAGTPHDVQETADRVSRLAVSDGGFVQSSHVQVQQTGTSEANIDLSLPSAKLNAALASLGQIAPVRAESQSLQDITNTYDAARQRLADATAERQALLRALSQATTESQIGSLHERISQNRSAIAQARSSLQAVSRHASTAEVEVTVLGDAHTASEGLTLHRGLHDAGRVLVVTLAVLLIAAAILVPLVLLIVALVTARRMWLRYQRERILDTR